MCYNFGNDFYDLYDNILVGMVYLCELFDWYGLFGVFVVYNVGLFCYEEYFVGGFLLDEM